MSTDDEAIFSVREILRYNRGQAGLSALILDFRSVRMYLARNKKVQAVERMRERRDSVN